MFGDFDYDEGDVVYYRAYGSRGLAVRRVLVTEKDSDIKNGRPGFGGHDLNDNDSPVWGYDSQIEKVERKNNRPNR